jgi:hypothetical protein
MKSVEDILDGLSEAERELHRDIIEECRGRESGLLHDRKLMEANSERLQQVTKKIMDDIDQFNQIFFRLSATAKKIRETAGSISLLSIPDDKFFKA